jgi:hypothetical protein
MTRKRLPTTAKRRSFLAKIRRKLNTVYKHLQAVDGDVQGYEESLEEVNERFLKR